ncbi:hypothetical protein B0H15DRAFT_841979 [Mycena belliarum]|uniref:Uncharacterized protein n=1 Tax=Mycena belliarum TaxID=1033014 RepID=A0AAD6XNV9_9AGAR|nr:hypothetical protein B0H15DRAFT_841979 [Mycena belliae]
MTEYDYSPQAYAQMQRTQNRIANWADDTAHCAPQYKSPFAPRSDVQNNFYSGPRAASPLPFPSSSRSAHRHPPRPSLSHAQGHHPSSSHVRSPLRSQTMSVVSPQDSISQVSGPRSSHRSHRARSHSPPRHRHRAGTGTYVVSPAASPTPQYAYGGGQYAQPVQYAQQVQYAQPVQAPYAQQPAAYVVVPRDRKVQIVYAEPQPQHAEQHPSLLQRVFGSQSGKHRRSSSHSHSRSGSRR